MLYNSKIICFTGTNKNVLISSNQVVLFDILTKRIIGLINLRLFIKNLKINYEGIYVIGSPEKYNKNLYFKNKHAKHAKKNIDENKYDDQSKNRDNKNNVLLVFSLKNLKLLHKVENIMSDYIKFCDMKLFKCSLILRQISLNKLEIRRCKV